jgi:hypothetical protein
LTEKNAGSSDLTLETAEAKIDLTVQLLHKKELIRYQSSVLNAEMIEVSFDHIAQL